VSFDHFAGVQASGGMHEAGFDRLLDLLRSGRIYVKLSAPELVSKFGPEYPDVAPLAKALIAANPERILWASHWPHPNSGGGRKATEITPLRQIDDGYIFNLLPLWAPDAADRKAILVDNPARLFGF
jgi:predicted TIM-barrel fold metal-dependent hydrolase